MPIPVQYRPKTTPKKTSTSWLQSALNAIRQRAATNAQQYQANLIKYKPPALTLAALRQYSQSNARSYAAAQPKYTPPSWLTKAANYITNTMAKQGPIRVQPNLTTPPYVQYTPPANYPTVTPLTPTQQFMKQAYTVPYHGIRPGHSNYVELPAYMRPGYVPGTNLAEQMPEKTYRKIFHQPVTIPMQTYPQGYAEAPQEPAAPYYDTGGGYGGYGGYGGGGGYSDKGYTGPADYTRQRGQLPYMPNIPRWLQGLVTWRI